MSVRAAIGVRVWASGSLLGCAYGRPFFPFFYWEARMGAWSSMGERVWASGSLWGSAYGRPGLYG